MAVVAIALGALWNARRPIADDAIRRSFAARGVEARYVVRTIGLRTQRLESISIGNPVRPDLTAEWAEVELVPSWGGVRVAALRAHGVRLRGRLTGGHLSWGAVDRLLPKSGGGPFNLPDIDATVSDAAVSLSTDMGPIGAALAGSGNLRDGFRGRLLALSHALQRDGCSGRQVRADVAIAISGRRPSLAGPVTVGSIDCAGAQGADLRADIRAHLPEALDRWTGDATLVASGVAAQGAILAKPEGRITFDGGAPGTRGTATLRAPAARYGDLRLAGLAFEGRYAGASLDGSAAVSRAIFRVPATPDGFSGTPIGPVAERLFTALRRAGSGTAVTADVSAGANGIRVARAVARLPGGGSLRLSEGTGIGMTRGKFFADTRIVLADPGLPAVNGRISAMPGGGFRGRLSVAPYAAGPSRIALTPVDVMIGADSRLTIDTKAVIDGPLGDGRIEGLAVPIVFRRGANGVMTVGQGCALAGFDRLRIGNAIIGRSATRLCPRSGAAFVSIAGDRMAGGVSADAVRLVGQLDGQPLTVSARTLVAGVDGVVAGQALAVRTGSGDTVTRLDIDRLDGGLASGGHFTGLAGQIGRVPLIVGRGQGTWRFARGALDLQGTAGVRDAADIARFLPMIASDVKLRFANSRIDATSAIREPSTGKVVTLVTLTHDLRSGTGEAKLKVDGLVFGKLQPQALVESTKAIVQKVQGQIDGSGFISWTPKGVTSRGRFTTENLEFSATAGFGSVAGVSGTVEFDDLLALSTPPSQRVTIKYINTGVEVEDGTISYRLRPNQVVEIESGHWPFAGGDLRLEPATLDFGEIKPRRLVFSLVGLDAAKFIQRLQLENIDATGTFDGTIPIVFDATGGQVVGGRLVARGAGTLAYVGDVSNSQTNAMTRLAFDALKSISYRNLAVELDGALDGEIVSRVLFTGTNKAPVAPTGLARSFTGLPFKFNVVVRAPFRGLVNTARSFQDPVAAIQQPESGPKP